MGFLDPKPVTTASLDSHPRLSATALNATYGKTVKVHKYGTNAAAFEAAAAEAGAGGTIMAEKWAGPYTIASPVTLTEVSLISDGATINVTALGSGVSALTFTSTGPRPDMWAEGFWLKGPGTRSLGVKNANVDGIQIAGSAMPKFRNVRVDNFDSGFVLNNGAGHIYWDHCNVTNNYYGVYCKLNSFDYFFKDCKINGNTFANFAAPADQGFEALVIRDSHIGFAPYGIYQEPTPINQGKPKLFLQEVILDHCRFEQIGNAAIFTEAQQDATNASITSNLRIIHPGFSWSPESGAGSYKIASRDRNYAVVLSQTDRVIEIEQGANAFSAGTLGTIRVKLAGHAAFILRGASGQAFAGQVTTDSGSANVYAFAAPVVPGTAQSFPQLDITGNGYIRWNGTTVRYGGDTTSQFADIAANGVWRVRNSGNGFASLMDVTPGQLLLPAGSRVVNVPSGSTAAQIQAIIDATPEGSIVNFGAAAFALSTQLVISKPLTLRGSVGLNGSTTSGTRFTMAAGVQAGVDGAIKVTGSYVTIENIVVEGAGYTNGSSGIRVQGVGAVHAHGVTIRGCLIRQFGNGVAMGVNSDHVNIYDSKIAGNNYGVTFEVGNMFDYGFFGCLLDGNVASSLYLAADASVANVTCVRTHLGFSQYGVLQEATVTGNGYAGLSLIDSPIESVSIQHMKIVNGGNIRVQGGYWLWTGTPANPAFSINNVNSGPVWVNPRLEPNTPNANSPAVVAITGSTSHPVYIDGPLSGFAQARYTSTGLQKNILLDGQPAGGTAAPTAGTWAVGDRIRNTNPSAGGPTGWVCVTAGTPGTWQAEAMLGKYMVESGTATNAILSMGTSSGYIRPQGSDARRFGADAGSIYADFTSATGGFIVRDANNGYAASATFSSAGLALAATGTLKSGLAATASRPSASSAGAGARFYDTTLSKPIWSDGTVWRDAAGTAV